MPMLYRRLTSIQLPQINLHSKFETHDVTPKNTRSIHFSSRDIQQIDQVSVTFQCLMEMAGDLATQDFPISELSVSPPRPIMNEHHFQNEVVNRLVVPIIRRAIEATHPHHTAIDGNTWPGNQKGGKPDVSFVEWDGEDSETMDMRFPLEVKLSVHWNSLWLDSEDPKEQLEYFSVLSQIHFYMDLFNTKYGGVLTEKELIIVYRTDDFGSIQVSQSIPFGDHDQDGSFTADEGRPTVAYALWCFSTTNDWFLEGHRARDKLEKDEDEDEEDEGGNEDLEDEDYVP